MAITKDEFIKLAENEMSNYPTISMRYQIGDPLIIQAIASIAAMCSQLTLQTDVTSAEPFTKARDVTVRADAAAKGILPFATPTIAAIKAINGATSPWRILAGRTVTDQQGHHWVVTDGLSLAAGATGKVTAKQVESRSVTHTVAVYRPFYTVELAEPDVGFIASVLVAGYEYSPDFANTLDGERVYNIRSDEDSRLAIQFGIAGLSGFQPAVGDVLQITIQDTEGELTLPVGMKFALDYITGPVDSKVTLELEEVTQTGAHPMDVNTMREICSYPGIYDNSAVFGSNFDFVVRKGISPVTFLSIWNEAKEEAVRGADLDNVNTIFIAARKAGTTDAALRPQISAIIERADNSYKHQYVAVVDVVVAVRLLLVIPSIYDSGVILQKARSILLESYGIDSAWAKRGEAKILEKDVHKLLSDGIVELQDRMADVKIISLGGTATVLPEHFRYVTDASLTIDAVEVS